jgi:uncharacterized protein (TIGR02266 family)
MDDERRAALRAPLTEGLRIQVEDLWIFENERLSNISETGMFISTSEPFNPGTIFNFSIDLGMGNQAPISAEAEVVWTREAGEDPSRPAGMGVRFVKISSEDLITISVFVNNTTPSDA